MNKDSSNNAAAPKLSDGEIIDKFGGIRPMAAKLGIAVTTVQGWKARGHIPENRRRQILDAAEAAGIDLGAARTPAAESEPPAPPTVTKAPEDKPAADEPPRAAVDPPRPAKAEAPAEPVQPKKTVPPPASGAAAATEKTAKEKATPHRSDTGRVAWIALGMTAVLAVAILSRPYWEPAVFGVRTTGSAGAELAAIERMLDELNEESQARFEELADRAAALEAGGGEAGAAAAKQLAALEKTLADVERTLASVDRGMQGAEDRLAALEAARGEVPESVTAALRQSAADIEEIRGVLDGLRTETTAQDQRLTTLETRPVQTGERIAALALAVGQVEQALNAGRPYRAALDRLAGIAVDDQLILDGVSALYDRSAEGVPGRPALQRRFDKLAPEIDRALADTGGDSWVDRVWHSLSTLVTVRRTEGPDTPPISRAETAMADGDLAGVIEAFDGAGSLGPEGDRWLGDVRARVKAENEVEALYGQVIAPLAATGGATR